MRNVIMGGVLLLAIGGYISGEMKPDVPVAIPAAAPGQSETAPRPVQDNVIAYHTSDKLMNDAKDKARDTLARFVKLMDETQGGTHTIKFPLTQNGETEHIWLQVDGFQNNEFTGRLANEPVNGTKYKMGQEMSVKKSDVEDWMVQHDGAIYGGYSARVMLKQQADEKSMAMLKLFRD